MNVSTNPIDMLEGAYLACNPTNGAKGYEFVCFFATRISASIQCLGALCSFYVAYQQMTIGSQTPHDVKDKLTKTSKKMSISGPHSFRGKAAVHHGVVVSTVLGINLTFSSLAWFFGLGCMYDVSDVRGQVGDAFSLGFFCTSWYMALIQIRGANWFESLVQLPTNSDGNKHTQCFYMPSVSTILDLIQGPFGTIIALALWLLLMSRTITRGTIYAIGCSFNALFGFRSFVTIATKRVTALRQVSAMQNKVRGTQEDKKRRQGILKSKVLGLVLDLTAVLSSFVLTSLSLPALGSTFNSRQFIVHNTIMNLPTILVVPMLIASIHIKIRKNLKRNRQVSAFRGRVDVESQASGLSVVEKSEVGGTTQKKPVGLFE